VERDLSGRCGTCSFFIALRIDASGADEGECRLGCWPPPLKDSATCPHHKTRGASWEGALKRKKVAGMPRTLRDDDSSLPPERPPLPQEIDLDMDLDQFRDVLRQVIQEELGVGDTHIGDRWQGGEIVLKPGKDGVQPKSIPIDQFFKKIVMIRDKLRVLEQKLNAHKGLTDEDKIQMQQYITGCYGSLTTFNVLFRERDDWFVGQSGKE
jgi:hypothetical protein